MTTAYEALLKALWFSEPSCLINGLFQLLGERTGFLGFIERQILSATQEILQRCGEERQGKNEKVCVCMHLRSNIKIIFCN